MLPRFSLSWRGPLLALVAGLASSAALADTLSVEGAHVRAVPPVSTTTAAFMQLHNAGDADRALVAASTPAARVAELHNHVDVDGVMQMRQVEMIPVPAGEGAQLAPGGYHLMLIDLVEPLHEGDEVALSLTFDDGQTLEVAAPVRRIETMGHGMPEEKAEEMPEGKAEGMSHAGH
ncbi:copper chaperone PCu(A)C [Halomonas sp. G15]|uniref:copper chaperone PCu(A)C n=1 Tax=Halomonas sp. G15 TaxID=2903521 RepID=UPI001E406BEC|nr:copper chaperone PCu(A)C [Halomonas sp. G15]MCE0732995.1 copper chaperone PCu(A)C [Halomonas sp. G15]